jgi:hypothetical protein
MQDVLNIENSLLKLSSYIEAQNYMGYDPYDALKSPLFNLPVLRSNKTLRFVAQQLVKRFPVNVRSILAIPKGYNPVTLGLCLQGYTYLYGMSTISDTDYRIPVTKEECTQKINFLIKELQTLIPAGYRGACWGYDFPWEARYTSIPAYQPTVVATGIITNALFECYKLTGNKTARELCISSAGFVVDHLNRTYEDDSLCFSYSPFDKQRVFNASMKGSRILSQAYSLIMEDSYRQLATESVKYVVNKQNSNGSWFYSASGKGEWIDNYHTGYVLDCLDEYVKCTRDDSPKEALQSGYDYYRNNFFNSDGQPKFYNNRQWPVDCTAGAQSILTLCRFGDLEMAEKVAGYLITNMQSPDGGFYFRKYRYLTEKTIFMRWSNAWMFAALSELLYRISTTGIKTVFFASEF